MAERPVFKDLGSSSTTGTMTSVTIANLDNAGVIVDVTSNWSGTYDVEVSHDKDADMVAFADAKDQNAAKAVSIDFPVRRVRINVKNHNAGTLSASVSGSKVGTAN